MIRKYEESDQQFLQETDMYAFMEVSYHDDVINDEVYTSVGEDKIVNGILYFKNLDQNVDKPKEFKRFQPGIICEDNKVKDELIDYAIKWYKEHVEGKYAYKTCLIVWEDHPNIDCIQQYLKKGFLEYDVCPCLKYDLKKDIPNYPVPDGFNIKELEFTPEAVNKYIEASRDANDGIPDSVNDVWFMSGEPSFACYQLMDGDRIVGVTSTWHITKERAAIENIFTTTGYRNQNMARVIITYVLKEIKAKGYSIATLGMMGRNKKASHLYQSLGFSLLFNQIELLYFK